MYFSAHDLMLWSSESFFWNKEYIERFYKTQSLAAKKEIPGYFYVSQIIAFDELHTGGGELYKEFLKAIVRPKQENFVTRAKLIASVALRVGASHGHTLLITKRLSPTILMYSRNQCVMTVESQRADDFQSRANIRKLVKEGMLNLNDGSIAVVAFICSPIQGAPSTLLATSRETLHAFLWSRCSSMSLYCSSVRLSISSSVMPSNLKTEAISECSTCLPLSSLLLALIWMQFISQVILNI